MKFKIVLLVSLFAFADRLRADVESDRAALRVIKTAYEEACKAGNPDKLAPFLGTNVTGVMVTGEEVAGLEGIKQYWARIQQLIGPGGTYSTALTVDHTDIFGDVSVSRGATDDVVRMANGREFKFTSRWSAVCRRENGAWKIHRMQASLDPVQNVFVDTRVFGAKMTFGIGGVISGLLLGLIFFRRRAKQTTVT